MTNLTKTAVEAITPALGKGQAFVWDDKVKGFGLRITPPSAKSPTGNKTYVLQYRPKGSRQNKRLMIGRHSEDFGPDKARKEADRLLTLVKTGHDPVAKAKAHKAELTVSAMLDKFLAEHVEPNNKASTAREERRLIEKAIKPTLGKLKLSDLTVSKVKAWHAGMKGTPTSANRALAHLQRACEFAAEYEWMTANPCKPITRYAEAARDRFFTDAELQRIGLALRELTDVGRITPAVADGIRLAALTGMRASEVRGLRWADYDPQAKVLRLTDAKAGARNVPLFIEAVALLNGMERMGAWIVAGADPKEPIAERSFSRAVELALDRAEVEDASAHTFRHTIATFMAQNRQDAFAICHVGGWKTLHMVQRYVARHAMGDNHPLPAGQRIAVALAGNNVVPLMKSA